jgi:hypothetical protein
LSRKIGAANLREITPQGDFLDPSLRLESCHAKAECAVPVLPLAIPADHAAVLATHPAIPTNLRAIPAAPAVHPQHPLAHPSQHRPHPPNHALFPEIGWEMRVFHGAAPWSGQKTPRNDATIARNDAMNPRIRPSSHVRCHDSVEGRNHSQDRRGSSTE